MATNLTSVAIKDGFQQLLHCDGGLTSTEASVIDGDGTASILSLGTTSATVGGALIVSGNLTVNGSQTILNTATLSVEDNSILLNSNVTGTPSANAGIEIERGDSTNTSIRWNESTDRWQFTNDGSAFYNFPLTSEYSSANTTFTIKDNNQPTTKTIADGKYLQFTSSGSASPAQPTLSGAGTSGDPFVLLTQYITYSAGNSGLVPAAGTSGHYLKHNGAFGQVAFSELSGTTAILTNSSNIGSLNNVDSSTPTNGQILKYNTGSSIWVVSDQDTANTTWVLEDGDSTRVTVADSKYVKFVEGGNIDINWTNTANGATDDEYDLTFTATNTNQLTEFYLQDDDGDSIHISHDEYIKFMNGSGITTNWNALDAAGTSGDPHILTITSTTAGTVNAIGVTAPITGGVTLNASSGTIGHSTAAGYTHVPTTASQSGKFLKAVTDSGGSEAWATLTEADISDLGTYLTTSQAQSSYLPKTSPTLTADTTLSMNNARISARTSAGGGSDGLGTAGQVLHSHASGGGVYWATVSDDMQWILEDHSGDQVTVADGKYVKFIAGTGLGINWTDTSNGAVDDEYDLTFTISGYNNSNWDTAYGWGNHASGGYLTGITGQAIGSLSNVDSSSPSNGQILKWSTDTWVVSDNTVTIGSINDITDVSITGTTDNYILMYENATGRWKNEPTTDITSVGTLTSLTTSGTAFIDGVVNIKETGSGHVVIENTQSNKYLQFKSNEGVYFTTNGSNHNYIDSSNLFHIHSATFSGNVSLDNSGSLTRMTIENNTESNILFTLGGASKGQLYADSNGISIRSESSVPLLFKTNGNTTALTLGTDQSATFTGNIITTSGSEANLILKSASVRSGILLKKPGTDTVMGSVLMMADESFRLGTYGHYHMHMLQDGSTTLLGDNTTALTIDTSQNATFAGSVVTSGSSIRLTGWSTKNISWGSADTGHSSNNTGARIEGVVHATSGQAHGALKFYTNSGDSAQNPLTLEESGNATFGSNATFANGKYIVIGDGDSNGYNTARSKIRMAPPQHTGNEWDIATFDDSGTAWLKFSYAGVNQTSGPKYLLGHSGTMQIDGDGSDAALSLDNGTQILRIDQNSIRSTTNTELAFTVNGGWTHYFKLQTGGGFIATGDITAYYSDARLKDFKGTIQNPLDKVMQLNGYYFTENKKAKALGYNNDKVQIGVSAQEVEAVLPELIKSAPVNDHNNTDYKTLDYGKLTPLLIEAIKELKHEINELKGIA